jgi:PAS domain-containing protein
VTERGSRLAEAQDQAGRRAGFIAPFLENVNMSDSATTPTHRNRPETAGIIALLLEQGPEEGFDRLTRLATMALRTPTAVLGLLSGARLLPKSQVGMPAPWELDPNEPLPHAMFRHSLATSKPFVVEDLRRHPLTKDMVLGEGWEHAAYCGVPIILANRKTVGVLAVFDPKPRPWTDREIGFLQDLAASAGQEIDDRMEPREAAEVIPDEALELLARAPDGFLSLDAEWRVTLVNSAAERILRRAANELVGMPLASVFPGVTGAGFQSGLERAFAEPGGVAFEEYCRSLHAWLEARAFPVNGDSRFICATSRLAARAKKYCVTAKPVIVASSRKHATPWSSWPPMVR